MTARQVVWGLLILIGLIVACGMGMLLRDQPDGNERTALPTLRAIPTAEVMATPAPREWTAEELAACDMTTASKQLAGDQDAGPMSDCEVALTLAYLDSSPLTELMEADKQELAEHEATLGQFNQWLTVYDDGVITPSEASFLCAAPLEQTYQRLQTARRFAKQHGLLGHEVDFLRAQWRLERVRGAC